MPRTKRKSETALQPASGPSGENGLPGEILTLGEAAASLRLVPGLQVENWAD